MNIIDNDPLKINLQLSWFKKHFKYMGEDNLKLINTIIKRLIFIKVGSSTSERFMNSIVYDALCSLNDIKNNRKRHFYFSYRSLIENLARSCLNKENDDETRITPLFQELQSLLNIQELYSQDIYSDLMNGYSMACGYVHNNQSSGIDIMLSYSQIDSTKQLEEQEIRKLLQQLLSLLNNSIRSLSLSRKESILRNFGRNFIFIEDLLSRTLAKPFIKP